MIIQEYFNFGRYHVTHKLESLPNFPSEAGILPLRELLERSLKNIIQKSQINMKTI